MITSCSGWWALCN